VNLGVEVGKNWIGFLGCGGDFGMQVVEEECSRDADAQHRREVIEPSRCEIRDGRVDAGWIAGIVAG